MIETPKRFEALIIIMIITLASYSFLLKPQTKMGEPVMSHQLRWCTNGQERCSVSRVDDLFVDGGRFANLEACQDELRHLEFYGNTLGGECVDVPAKK